VQTPTKKLIRHPAQNINERPFMVIWETTMACDLACRHCRAEAIATQDPKRLTTEEGRRLLDQIRSFGKPTPIVVLTGGDPFKREDIFELTAYGTRIGLPMAISPSATPLLTRDNLQRLRDAGAKVISLSLDGATAAAHDSFRGVEGSFEMTLDGWQAAQDIGLKVQINTTVTRHNLDDLPAILQRVRAQGVMTWSVFFLVPTGRGLLEDEITPEEYEDVMHWLYDASRYIRIKTTEGHHYKRVVVQRSILDAHGDDPVAALGLGATYTRLRNQLTDDAYAPLLPEAAAPVRRAPMNINAASGFVFVSRRGEVFPSGFMPLSAGNIRQQSLVDIYRDAALFRQLRQTDNLQGRCGQCEFKAICGGSRSRAYAMTGNPLAEEPFCTYQPGSFAYAAELPAYLQGNLS
jgi:AdoMet-dependent heme synthase